MSENTEEQDVSQAVRTRDDPEMRENIEAEGSPSAGCANTGYGEAENSSIQPQGRNRKEPIWMQDYVLGEELLEEDRNLAMFATFEDPVVFEEAVKGQNWREAMRLEIKAITENDTWELTTLPKGAKKIGVKWVYKTKLNEKGEVDKFKARFVAKGYSQQYVINYN